MSNASEQLLDEIRNCDQEFMDAYNAGDANAVAQLYDDKCSLMPANMEPIHSKKGRKKFIFSGANDKKCEFQRFKWYCTVVNSIVQTIESYFYET